MGKVSSVDSVLLWNRSRQYYKTSWRGRYKTDGGVLANQAIHLLDMLVYLFGPIKKFNVLAGFEKKKLQYVDLIKIDTEGHEYEVLTGASNNIQKIVYLLVEIHNDNIYENYSSKKIHNFLIENNFKLLKRFNFPFTTWEDRLYKNSKL